MAEDTLISRKFDELALQIMMVEPGDLSELGDLVVLVEGLGQSLEMEEFSVLKRMVKTFEEVLGQIVMAQLDDTAENYEQLGKCITQMQEIYRKNDDDLNAEKLFNDSIEAVGYEAKESDLADVREEVPGAEPAPPRSADSPSTGPGRSRPHG